MVFDLLPDEYRGQLLALEIAIDTVMVYALCVVSQIRAGIVDLARQQVLTVDLPRRLHVPNLLRFDDMRKS